MGKFRNLFSFDIICLILIGIFSVTIKFVTDWHLNSTNKVITFTESIDEFLTYGDLAGLTVAIFLLTAFQLLTGDASIKNRWVRIFLYCLIGFSVYLINYIFF